MISQWELKFETSKLLEVLENANDQGVIVFSVLSDLCREWLKPQQSQIAPSAFLIYSMENCFKETHWVNNVNWGLKRGEAL